MWPDWVSNPGPLAYESNMLSIALRISAFCSKKIYTDIKSIVRNIEKCNVNKKNKICSINIL